MQFSDSSSAAAKTWQSRKMGARGEACPLWCKNVVWLVLNPPHVVGPVRAPGTTSAPYVMERYLLSTFQSVLYPFGQGLVEGGISRGTDDGPGRLNTPIVRRESRSQVLAGE